MACWTAPLPMTSNDCQGHFKITLVVKMSLINPVESNSSIKQLWRMPCFRAVITLAWHWSMPSSFLVHFTSELIVYKCFYSNQPKTKKRQTIHYGEMTRACYHEELQTRLSNYPFLMRYCFSDGKQNWLLVDWTPHFCTVWYFLGLPWYLVGRSCTRIHLVLAQSQADFIFEVIQIDLRCH